MKLDLDSTQKFFKSKSIGSKPKAASVTAGSVSQIKLASKESSPSSSSPDYKVSISKPDLPVPSVPSIDLPKVVEKIPQETIKTEKIEKKQELLNKPGLFFISGLDVFSGSYSGVNEIADSIQGSEIFKWNESDKILEAINNISPDYPIILVGHSLGGDTAYEIADQLDSLEYKFRPVDVLVTIDAIGFNHDIVPQNVKKHLNIFGENSLFLKDGPHVARREEKTQVRNILSPKDHTEIDDDREVQFEVVRLIQENMKKKGS